MDHNASLALKRTHAHWGTFFGLTREDYFWHQPMVLPHAELAGYQGAWLFRQRDKLIISVPMELWRETEAALAGRLTPDFSDEAFIELFGGKVTKVIGPAYHGYLEPEKFQPVLSKARPLTEEDATALRELQAACSTVDWEYGGLDEVESPRFGLFRDGTLVAAASYVPLGPVASSPGIVTHPAHRGRGYATAVLSAAVEHGLQQGHLMLYQTLKSNTAAIRAAEKIGYVPYATHLAVRLRIGNG